MCQTSTIDQGVSLCCPRISPDPASWLCGDPTGVGPNVHMYLGTLYGADRGPLRDLSTCFSFLAFLFFCLVLPRHVTQEPSLGTPLPPHRPLHQLDQHYQRQQVLTCISGRDDGLFVGAAANSGFGGYTPSFVGGLNNTDGVQEVFDNLVRNTSCAEYVGTADAIPCLREVDFEEINTAVNVTGVGPFIHVKDDDLIQTYPANALRDGQFVKVPILIGANSDEGTAFGSGIVDTDEDLAEIIKAKIPSNPESGKTADQAADELLYVYPDVQSVGIPNLASFPDVITEGSELAEELGLQYRRRNALIGDLSMHYIRRRANIAWSNWGVPSYSWRFDVTVNGVARMSLLALHPPLLSPKTDQLTMLVTKKNSLHRRHPLPGSMSLSLVLIQIELPF